MIQHYTGTYETLVIFQFPVKTNALITVAEKSSMMEIHKTQVQINNTVFTNCKAQCNQNTYLGIKLLFFS